MPRMPRLLPHVLCLTSLAAAVACNSGASSAADSATAQASVASVSGTASNTESGIAMVDHLGRELEELGSKMVQLAEAMPEETYAWAPMEGVRSVGAVFAHVAGDNYFVPALLGQPVEGTGVTTESGIKVYEDARGSKAEIVAELKRSFDVMRGVMAASRTEPDKPVVLRGNTITQGDLWVRAIVHLHEHLGQSIAYARANKVVPPWSAGS
jgi:hypothetical protein